MLEGELVKRPAELRNALAARGARVAGVLRRHLGLVALVGVAAVLRAVALFAIFPGIWFPDGNDYVKTATTGVVSIVRVSGYSLLVAPFVHAGGAAALIVLQHVLGLALVVLVYAFLLRRGVSRLLACLAVLPLALDAYLIVLEHMIMSETLFHLTVIGALAALLWHERATIPAAGGSGLLVGYAGTVRSVALPFVALFVLYLVARRAGVYPVLALAAGWALVVGGYLTLFKLQHGEFALTQYSGRFLYTQVAPFADCAKLSGIPADERFLCPNPRRRLPPNGYIWSRRSPASYELPPALDDRVHDFSVRVIKQEPLLYLRSAAGDFLHYFEPGYRARPVDVDRRRWEFPGNPYRWKIPGYRGPLRDGNGGFEPGEYVNAIVGQPSIHGQTTRFLHYYQRYLWTTGQLLSGCLLVVLVALAWRRRPARRLRLDAALIASCAVTALLVAAALSVFDYRYGLVAVVLLPPAAALAATALLGSDGERPAATTA